MANSGEMTVDAMEESVSRSSRGSTYSAVACGGRRTARLAFRIEATPKAPHWHVVDETVPQKTCFSNTFNETEPTTILRRCSPAGNEERKKSPARACGILESHWQHIRPLLAAFIVGQWSKMPVLEKSLILDRN